MANAQAKYVIKLEDKTKRAFKAIGKSLKRTTSAVFSMKTGFVSAAGIAGIGYFVKKSLDATDEMAKMSRAIGVSVENLQRLRHAASLGGLEATQLDKAVQKLSVNMADMSKGIGLAKDVFEKYNISVENSDGTLRDVVDVMADVADVTSGLTNKTEKADLAYKLFGARGGKMINVLEGGSVAMREAMMEADKLGLVMSAETAQGVEKANDAFTRFGSYLTSAFHQAVAKLAPAIKSITDSMREWVQMKIDKAGGIGAVAKQMAVQVLVAVDKIIGAIEFMANSFVSTLSMIRDLNPFSSTVSELTSEIEVLNKEYTRIKDLIGESYAREASKWMEAGKGEKLTQLQQELKIAKTFESIKPVDFSEQRSSIFEYIRAIKQAKNAVGGLGGDGDGGGDGDKKTTKKTIWDKMKAGFEDYKETVKKGSLDIASITAKTMKSTEDAIVNMMMGIKTDFKSMARSIAADLVRMQVQRNITKPLDKIISNIDFSDFFRASGGAVKGGQTYMVGERGAELFTPGASGTITPNHELGGGGQVVNVTYAPQVNALDPRTAATVIAQNAPTIVGVIRQAFNRNGKAVAI